MVEPAAFERQGDGSYLAEVTDESAHAWVEILLEDYGWTLYVKLLMGIEKRKKKRDYVRRGYERIEGEVYRKLPWYQKLIFW